MFFRKTKWRFFLCALPFWQLLTDNWARVTNWPLVGKASMYLHNDDHYDVTFVPINQDIEQDASTVLPRQVVEEMVRRAVHRVILPICLCRVGCRCQDFPMELGCIFLGESAKQIDPSMGRAVSVEEGLEHVDKAIQAGLVLQIGRVDADPFMLGIKPRDRDRFLTLCFCCPCCCVAMRNMPRWAPEMKGRMHALEGLSIEVTDDCNGCGRCVDACFAGAISIENERAVISDACKGCGICASTCSRHAVEIRVEDGNRMLEEAFRRIERYADVT